MRTISFILQKEFLQIFRNKSMLPIIFIVPVFQLIVLVNAATFEMKNIRLQIIDYDHSSYSRSLISHFTGSPFYKIERVIKGYSGSEEGLKDGSCDAIMEIPAGFEKSLVSGLPVKVQLMVNAINGTSGGLTFAYTQSVIGLAGKELVQSKSQTPGSSKPVGIDITYSYWYNPELNYKTFMVPGILVLLVTIISLLLSSMNIVREKEMGTIEQINVTPIQKYQFITGKLIPFLVIALFELSFGLTIGKLLFNIPLVGNLGLIFLVATVYICGVLGIGLLVSTMTHTQQQAMFISFFFMIIFILMSGLFTAIENMPEWAQLINRINPVAYFIRVMRMVLLKGSGFQDIRQDFISLILLAFSFLSLATWRYRKTV